ncbi:hypothetical protein JKF63_02765 [Porcisia hertigi]|uniref:AB hydrolase-1 domain-containing protein n=1 Tax=Porcisia hertigi TaxID=2761500 RepID=A0A836HSU1_9TRYP|nr:hypothetical protein JKF63_02765 [Porcisia hertigi]
MSREPPSSGAAAVLVCHMPFTSKVKFLCIHLFCAVVLDFVPRLVRWFSGFAFCTKSTAVYGSLEAKRFFDLDRLEKMPYADPPYSGHVGTILCSLRPHRNIPYERVVHPSTDGNPMHLDWLLTDTSRAKGVFIIVPGLASWSGTNYIQHFVWFASTRHFHCVVFNSRGMGDTPIETPRLMSGKWTEDLRAVLRDGPLSRGAIQSKCRARLPIIGVGFSMGGVILCKYVGEESLAGREHVIDAVMLVNAPLDCLYSSTFSNRGISKALYQPRMARGLVEYAFRHREVVKNIPGLAPDVRAALASDSLEMLLKQVKSVRDFDLLITAPSLGFATPEDYYHHVSPIHWLPHFSVPVLCISAVDDPVVGEPPMESLTSTMGLNHNVAVIVTPHGGHIGYIRSFWDEWVGTETLVEKIIFHGASAIKSMR